MAKVGYRKSRVGLCLPKHGAYAPSGGHMKELNQVKRLLLEALERAKSNQHQYGEEWRAVRQRGIEEAIAIVDRVRSKAALLP
jgi:hypothetical protein